MNEIPPVQHPPAPLPKDRKLKDDRKPRDDKGGRRQQPPPPASDGPSQIDEYA